MTNHERNPADEWPKTGWKRQIRGWGFVIPSAFVIRHSSFASALEPGVWDVLPQSGTVFAQNPRKTPLKIP
jgi:hypothetical protein